MPPVRLSHLSLVVAHQKEEESHRWVEGWDGAGRPEVTHLEFEVVGRRLRRKSELKEVAGMSSKLSEGPEPTAARGGGSSKWLRN